MDKLKIVKTIVILLSLLIVGALIAVLYGFATKDTRQAEKQAKLTAQIEATEKLKQQTVSDFPTDIIADTEIDSVTPDEVKDKVVVDNNTDESPQYENVNPDFYDSVLSKIVEDDKQTEQENISFLKGSQNCYKNDCTKGALFERDCLKRETIKDGCFKKGNLQSLQSVPSYTFNLWLGDNEGSQIKNVTSCGNNLCVTVSQGGVPDRIYVICPKGKIIARIYLGKEE